MRYGRTIGFFVWIYFVLILNIRRVLVKKHLTPMKYLSQSPLSLVWVLLIFTDPYFSPGGSKSSRRLG